MAVTNGEHITRRELELTIAPLVTAINEVKGVLNEMRSQTSVAVEANARRIDALDKEGSVGTRQELTDHEARLRTIEKWMWRTVPPTTVTAAATAVAFVVRALN